MRTTYTENTLLTVKRVQERRDNLLAIGSDGGKGDEH